MANSPAKRDRLCPKCRVEAPLGASACASCGWEWDAYEYLIQCFSGNIPTLPIPPIILKKNEEAYYASSVSVYEAKNDSPRLVGAGSFVITNTRIVLSGASKVNYSIALAKINDWAMSATGINIHNEGRYGGRTYTVDDQWRVSVILSSLLKLKATDRSLPIKPFDEHSAEDRKVLLDIMASRGTMKAGRAEMAKRIQEQEAAFETFQRRLQWKRWYQTALNEPVALVILLVILPPVGLVALLISSRFRGGWKLLLFLLGFIALGKWIQFLGLG